MTRTSQGVENDLSHQLPCRQSQQILEERRLRPDADPDLQLQIKGIAMSEPAAPLAGAIRRVEVGRPLDAKIKTRVVSYHMANAQHCLTDVKISTEGRRIAHVPGVGEIMAGQEA